MTDEIWYYRVIRKNGRFGIHEVYDDESEIVTCSEEPVRLQADSLENLREDLQTYDWALELPCFDYRSIVPDSPEDDELEIEVEFGRCVRSRLDKMDYGCCTESNKQPQVDSRKVITKQSRIL